MTASSVFIFKKSVFKKIISFVFIGTIFSFIIKELSNDWQSVAYTFKSAHINCLMMSFFFGILYNFTISLGWYSILKINQERVTFFTSNWLLVFGNLGKYIPGKIWQVASRVYLFNNIGIKKTSILKYMGVELILFILSASMLFLCSSYFYGSLYGDYSILGQRYLIVVGLIFYVICLNPRVLNRILMIGIRKRLINQNEIEGQLNIKWSHIFIIQTIYITGWIFAGLSLTYLIFAVSNIKIELSGFIIGSLSIAYIVGYVTLFAPGGIGVREGILTVLLSSLFPLSIAGAIAISFRIIGSLCEALYIAASYLITHGIIRPKIQ